MGYRANVVTQHREYGSQTFCDWENFTNNFVPALEEFGIEVNADDAMDFYEVEKGELQKYVDSLPDNEEQSVSTEHTNKELKDELQIAINESKESWVSWEWF